MSDVVLVLEGVTKRFGGILAVDRVTAAVESGAITGLIGANGSGKTTLLNLVCGLVRTDEGTIRFGGRPIHRLAPDAISRIGIARTFQRPRTFLGLSVIENLLVVHPRGGDAAFCREVQTVVKRFGLDPYLHIPAAELSFGYQKRLELARAQLTKPRLFLLDEIFAGVDPGTIAVIADDLRRLRAAGAAVVVVDHDMEILMALCDTLLVLDHGRLIASGPPEAIQRDEVVIAAYLGEKGAVP